MINIKNKDKILFFTDLDGTFLPHNKIPSEENLNAIQRIIDSGFDFTFATGRTIHASKQYIELLNTTAPIILSNGCSIYDKVSDKTIYDVYLNETSKSYISHILDKFNTLGCEINTQFGVYVPRMNEFEKEHNQICKIIPILCKPEEIHEKGWHKALFTDESDVLDELTKYVKESNFTDADFVRSAKNYFEIIPFGASKGDAIKYYKENLGFSDYTIITMGDYDNDIEMIKNADIGFCPSNATENVKKASDIVLTKSNNENAFAEMVDFVFSNL